MPVTINASASTGLVSSADTSGVIQLQSDGTTALTVNTNEGIQILNCLGVGNATPSTSGAGITFPATASASSDANTLDDYEEGTWTPTVGGTATYSSRSGQYVKVGRAVTVWGQLTISSIGSSSGQVIGGLPFSSIYECTIPVDKSQSLTSAITWIALRVSGTDLYAVSRTSASTSGNINPVYMGSGSEMQFCGTYII